MQLQTVFSENYGYRQLKELGQGGFGCVFLAEATKKGETTKKHVALKQFNNAIFDTAIYFGYENEWKKLRNLEGNNFVTALIEKFEYHGTFFVVTEFCEVRKKNLELQVIKRPHNKNLFPDLFGSEKTGLSL